MKELELKYGCNPNQKPSKIFMNDGELMSTLGDYDIIDKLEIMVNNSFNDKRWLNNWSNPVEMVQSLNKILEKIKIYRGKIK